MKKHLRMIAGIILHPVRILVARYYRDTYQTIIRRHILQNWHDKNYERLHYFDGDEFPGSCSFSRSQLCMDLYRGAL